MFFKVSQSVMIPACNIEAICSYDSRQVKDLYNMAVKKGNGYRCGTKSIRTVIITKDGDMFSAPFLPQTYVSRLPEDMETIRDSSNCFIVKSHVTQVVTKLNESYRELVKLKKESGMFVNSSRKRKTNYYVLAYSGFIYACNRLSGIE